MEQYLHPEDAEFVELCAERDNRYFAYVFEPEEPDQFKLYVSEVGARGGDECINMVVLFWLDYNAPRLNRDEFALSAFDVKA